MAYVNPTVTDFQQYFVRDFPYGTTLDTVTDTDILNAINQTTSNINQALFDSQGAYNIGFFMLTAHYLVIALRSSSQGVAGEFDWLNGSKSVGSVSESMQIPQRLLDNPEFAFLSKTNYGTQYLMIILPLLTGQMFVVCGRTNP